MEAMKGFEEMKSEAVRGYVYFTLSARHTPSAVECMVRFKDGEEARMEEISFKRYEEGSNEDGEVFFYCDGLEEFIQLLKDGNGEDFAIVEILEFV